VKFVTRITDILLYTSLLTAGCATALCMATERLINGYRPPMVNALHALVFGSALLVYNAQHILRRGRRPAGIYLRLRKFFFLFFFAGFALVITSLFWLTREVLIAAIILAMFTFTYSWPLLPFRNLKRLREIGWLKILVLAGVWTIVTSILPILYCHASLSDYPYEILLRLMFIFTLCIVFDIRDMRTDSENNITTLPNKVGLENSYRLINIILLLFVIISVVQFIRYPLPDRLAGAFVTAVITKMVVGYLRKYPSGKAYLGLADGLMMFYAVLILVSPNP
jgi:4-hydroxybenzoate polyprenyltransferase